MLEPGSTVRLAARGHITPLAADTLQGAAHHGDRRGHATTPPGMSLVPVADMRRIAIGSDHVGFDLKAHLIGVLRGRGLQVQDAGHGATDAGGLSGHGGRGVDRSSRGRKPMPAS